MVTMEMYKYLNTVVGVIALSVLALSVAVYMIYKKLE